MGKTLAIGLLAFALAGCSYFTSFVEEHVAEKVGEYATDYCAEPMETRADLREAINAGWEGRIVIECPDEAQ